MILEHIPTKFLNKTISFISSLNLLFLSLSDSTTIGANSTLFNPTYISEFPYSIFLWPLEKTLRSSKKSSNCAPLYEKNFEF